MHKRLGFLAGDGGSPAIVHEMSKKVARVIGGLKTIDNDLIANHLGFDTAVTTTTDALDKLHITEKTSRLSPPTGFFTVSSTFRPTASRYKPPEPWELFWGLRQLSVKH